MIDRILIPPRYTFFSGNPPAKNSVVKRAWSGAISVKSSRVRMSEDKCAQKRLWLICGTSL
jgi:hypothetical protein